MVSNEREGITFALDIDTSLADERLSSLHRRAAVLAKREEQLRIKIANVAQKAAGLAMSMIGFTKAIFSVVCFQLDALQEAVLLSIQQVINTAVAWFTLQAAMAANPLTAVIGTVGLIAAGAALGVALGNAALIAVFGDQVKTQMGAINSAIGNLEGIATGIIGFRSGI